VRALREGVIEARVRLDAAQSHYFAGGLRTVPPRLELFPFRYRDAVSGKWVRARYLAERHIIDRTTPSGRLSGRRRSATSIRAAEIFPSSSPPNSSWSST